jgi:hypothetical protein
MAGGGLKDKTYTFTHPNYNSGNPTDAAYATGFLDYNLGVLGEFYFLSFVGVGVGGGLGTTLSPYIRAEVPFLFQSVKLGVGFDYLFWKSDDLFFKTEKERGANLPAGYRINFFLSFRGQAAAGFANFLGAWFSY